MKTLIFSILFLLTVRVGICQSRHFPDSTGITTHTISEDKIQLMRNCNIVNEKIRKYKKFKYLGYGLSIIGAATVYYACDKMDFPYYTGYEPRDKLMDRRKRRRHIVGYSGAFILGCGITTIIINERKLRRINFNLTPTTGGIRFYF